MSLWRVEYVDRRDDRGVQSRFVEAASFDLAWRTLESDDVVCVKSCTSRRLANLIKTLDSCGVDSR